MFIHHNSTEGLQTMDFPKSPKEDAPLTPTRVGLPRPVFAGTQSFTTQPTQYFTASKEPRKQLYRTDSIHDAYAMSQIFGDHDEEIEELGTPSSSDSDPEVVQDEEEDPVEDDSDHEFPDLTRYFMRWPDMAPQQRIKIASAYAALQRAQLPPTNPRKALRTDGGVRATGAQKRNRK